MKQLFTSAFTMVAAAISLQAAPVNIKITNVHMCCPSCVKGAEKAAAGVPGVSAMADQQAGYVNLAGPDFPTVQKAADALMAAGYFGNSNELTDINGKPLIKMTDQSGATGTKVKSLKVQGVHLCCAKCVKAVTAALATVPGVTTNTAAKGATSFEISGDFNDKAVFAALQKAGLTGKIGK